MTIDAESTGYLISILRGMHTRGELVLSPKFQRRPVWPSKAKSFFIDTLLRGFPVPPLHLRVVRRPGDEDSKLEVVDGQQRLRAVFDFLAGDIRLSRSLDGEWAGKKFAQLEEDLRLELLDRRLTVFQYKSISDQDVLQIFERFNVNSIQLSAQELRNGRFFGQFKQSSYSLAREYLEYWRAARIFSEQAVARMLEVEFVSELLILQIAGLQDKKNSITDFYDRYDDDWGGRPVEEVKFRTTLDAIASAIGPEVVETAFTKRPLFYTLCGAVLHRLYGVPGVELQTPKAPLSSEEEEGLRDAVYYWTEVLSRSEEGEPIAKEEYNDEEGSIDGEGELALVESDDEVQEFQAASFTLAEQQFREAATSQTDNIGPRRVRLRLFYQQAFGEASQL